MLTVQKFKKLTLKEKSEKGQIDFSDWHLWENESWRVKNEDFSNKEKVSKLKELDKKLKAWDYTYVYSDERNAYKKGVAQEQEILKLYKEIGAKGLKMYRDFLKSKGMREGRNEIGIYNYERYYNSKLKKWGIKDTTELCPEDKKKFDNEVDRDWKVESEVKVNIPEHITPQWTLPREHRKRRLK
jgi:hypothetical protein